MSRMLGLSQAATYKCRADYVCCGRHFPDGKARSRRRRRMAEKRQWRREVVCEQ